MTESRSRLPKAAVFTGRGVWFKYCVRGPDYQKQSRNEPLIGTMPIKIGFAVLSHDQPHQLLRLATTLNATFGNPPIVCHHDFSKSSVEQKLFPENVRFVQPHIATRWGRISVPLAALRAFRMLMESDPPDWFVLLSGSDYPVRPAEEIMAELSGSDYDAYLDCREVLYRALPPGQTAGSGFGRPEWIPLAYDRYFAVPLFWWPRLSRTLLLSGRFPLQKKYVFLRNPSILHWLQNERPPRIYGGDFWFQANRKAIGRVLNDPYMLALMQYFHNRWNVDESLFHTFLCSQSDLRICRDHKRYEDWSRIEKHPKWLEIADVPKIMASGAHFARKFRPDGVVQDFIDETVLGVRATPWRHATSAGLDAQLA